MTNPVLLTFLRNMTISKFKEFLIIMLVITIFLILELSPRFVNNQYEKSQYNKACKLQSSGYEVYMDGKEE